MKKKQFLKNKNFKNEGVEKGIFINYLIAKSYSRCFKRIILNIIIWI